MQFPFQTSATEVRSCPGLTNISTLHHIIWSLKREKPPDKMAWQDEVYFSVHPDCFWRPCLLLLGHVIVLAWVKATEFSHLLPFRGGDAERRVHLIIGLSASVFMLDFRFCPAHSRDCYVWGSLADRSVLVMRSTIQQQSQSHALNIIRL